MKIKSKVSSLLIATLLITSILSQAASALSITSISPASGPIEGGNTVTIKGDFVERVKFTQVQYGYDTGLALGENGKLYTWGRGDLGQLGNGQEANSSDVIEVDMSGALNGKTISQISMGGHTALVLTSDNKLYAWGYNQYGQLGNGTYNTPIGDNWRPVEVSMAAIGNKTVSKIISGFSVSMVLTTDNVLYSWGVNNFGQAGQGTNTAAPVLVPKPVVMTGDLTGSTIKLMHSGQSFSAVTNTDNEVFLWGYNGTGQLGTGNLASSPIPRKLNPSFLGGNTIREVKLQQSSVVLSDNANNVYSWGLGNTGQLGNGATANVLTPTKIMDASYGQLKGVYTGPNNGVAVYDNTIYTWGLNSYGQLAAHTADTFKSSPQQADISFGGIDNIMFGYRNFIYQQGDKVYGNGFNGSGQLGNGTSLVSSAEFLQVVRPIINQVVSVSIAGIELSDFKLIDDNTIEIAVPAHASGKVDIRLASSNGNIITLADGYEYLLAEPEIEVPNTGVAI